MLYYPALHHSDRKRLNIAANRSVQATAERLHIHTNTLYLRLRKIEEILGVDLNDSEGWMKVYLACHLSEVYSVAPTASGALKL